MSLLEQFKAFILRGNVTDLAVGVVIGGAFGKIVTALVDDIMMPLVSPLLPGGDWREAVVTPFHLKVGHLLGTTLDFLIVAGVIFLVMVKLAGALTKKIAPPVAPTKTCTECLETIPKLAKRCKFCTSVLAPAVVLLLCMTGTARAQTAPVFEYVKPEEAPSTLLWAAQVKGGWLVSRGNAVATSGTLGGTASCKFDNNKLSLDLVAAYGEFNNRVYVPANGGDPTVVDSPTDIVRQNMVATNNALAKGRYDRALDDSDALYVLATLGQDKIAGKRLFGGGQLGYSRLLFQSDVHKTLAEAGYDFSDELYDAPGASAVVVHSARFFLGDTWKLSEATGIFANAEALFNLNKETNAMDAHSTVPTMGVPAFKDTRVNGKLGITTVLTKGLSFGFGVSLKYDQNPAPLAPTPAFGPAYRAFAETLDVLTDASLIVTLL